MNDIRQPRGDRPAEPPASASSASSVAFFTALLACASHSALPHPVHVRNSGLLRAWQQWDTQQALRLDDLLASRERRFSQHRDMVDSARGDADAMGRCKKLAWPVLAFALGCMGGALMFVAVGFNGLLLPCVLLLWLAIAAQD